MFKAARIPLFVVLLSVLLASLWPPAPCVHAGGKDTTAGGAENTGTLGDPVSTSIGEYYFSKPLLDLGGPIPIEFTLYYASRNSKLGGFHNDPFGGDAFTHNYHISLRRLGETAIIVLYTEGNLINFEKGSDWQVVDEEVVYQLQEDDGYYYMMDPIRERVYNFRKATALWGSAQVGALTRIEDRNGNALTFTNAEGEGNIHPTQVEDGMGRSLDFTYMNPTPTWNYPHLASVTDQAGRTIQFEYDVFTDEDWAVHLKSVTDPMAMETSFSYAGPLVNNVVVSQTLPRGNVPCVQTYEQEPVEDVPQEHRPWRVVAQTDAYGSNTTLSFDDETGVTTITDPLGNTYQHTHQDRRLLTEWTDEADNTVTMDYDDLGRRTSITDRLGDTTQITYHPETGKIASYTDAEGNTTTFTYTAQEQSFNPVTFTFYNLTRITYADGSHDDFAYDEHGNVTAYTDRAGKIWQYQYNLRGQVTRVNNPAGGAVDYIYNADGTLGSSADSDVGVTTYGYDVYKRLEQITQPDGSTVHFTYDLNDRLLSFTDELGQTTTFTYDGNGNLVTATNPLNQTYTAAYDPMDQLTGRTDPLGQDSTYTYSEMGQPASFTDRNGHITTFSYDARGWLTGITDPAGHIWTTAYDDEGVPTTMSSPLGRTITLESDKMGRPISITDPQGAHTSFIYDVLGRLTSTTDRLGRTTGYDYDDEGRLVGVTRPAIGTATYTRDDLGLLTRIADLRGKHWNFGYSQMGHLTSHTDPLGRQWTYAYDNQGQLQQMTYPDGNAVTITYDHTGQVTKIAYSDGPVLDYAYDDAGRLLTANDLALTYDARGDIINSQEGEGSFGATYDPGRRLRTVTYDDQATVTYTYDERNLLIRVEDDLSGAWMAFAYDDDGQLTEITRSNGISTTYSYDAAGWVTRIQDGGVSGALADQRYALNAEGEPTQAVMTVPLAGGAITYTYDNAGRLTSADYGGDKSLVYSYDSAGNLLSRRGSTPTDSGTEAKNYVYDDASQISSSDYIYDGRGRQAAAPGKTYAYDGASRLIQVTVDANTVNLTYNGLGDLRSRRQGGTTIHYYHNYAVELAPIVAEKAGATYKRFYVYSPGGWLLYSIDPSTNQVRFYHFDRGGCTLMLTDGGGGVSDAYAYDPYGNLLDHTGMSDQPFTFVGRYGVRWEPVSGLYHMRARYYDPIAARFLTRDTVWPVLDVSESLSPYQYAHQNPLKYVDPEGTRGRIPGRLVQTGRNQYVIMRNGREVGTVRYVDGRRIVSGIASAGGPRTGASQSNVAVEANRSPSNVAVETGVSMRFSAPGGGEVGATAGRVEAERTTGRGAAPDRGGAFRTFAGHGTAAGWREGHPEAASAGLAGVRTPAGTFGVSYAAETGGPVQTISTGVSTPLVEAALAHSGGIGRGAALAYVAVPGGPGMGGHALVNLPTGRSSLGGALTIGGTRVLGIQAGTRYFLPTATVSTPIGDVSVTPWGLFGQLTGLY